MSKPEGYGGLVYPSEWKESVMNQMVPVYSKGITLRNYYAGLAMQAIHSNPARDYYDVDLAVEAYKIADAMIAEGKQQ